MKEYKTTTNNRVFKILHKEQYASCSYCTWHSRWFGKQNENDAWKFYCIDHDQSKWNITRYPNWKLCTKNKKQWMRKAIRYRKAKSRFRTNNAIFIIEW